MGHGDTVKTMTMKIALIVGVDDYMQAPLTGCINDAIAVEQALSTNDDGSPNFWPRLLISSSNRISLEDGPRLLTPSSNEMISRSSLKAAITQLFSASADVALFYFSGHGLLNELGGYLVTQDAARFEEGVAMADVLAMANQSNIREIVIILDCCHSGAFGSVQAIAKDTALLRQGISVLCASRGSEAAIERAGRGLFSALVCEALYGGAAGLLGEVTAADVYSFVDRTIAPWDQRPLFKCHVSRLTALRSCNPQIAVTVLRKLPEFFVTPDAEFALDPSYEAYQPNNGLRQEEVRIAMRNYRAVGLVAPAKATDMLSEALLSGTCRLTRLGRYYWKLVRDNLI